MEEKIVVNGKMSVSDIASIGQVFFESGLFTDVKSKNQAIVKIIAGQELGIPPMMSMQKINIIKGKVALSSELMANILKKSGKYNYKIIRHTKTECVIKFSEKIDGAWADIGESMFTIGDAREAGLLAPKMSYDKTDKTDYNMWMKYPKNLLFARAFSNGCRWYCPDLGLSYTPDELNYEEPNGPIAEVPIAEPREMSVSVSTEEKKLPPEKKMPELTSREKADNSILEIKKIGKELKLTKEQFLDIMEKNMGLRDEKWREWNDIDALESFRDILVRESKKKK